MSEQLSQKVVLRPFRFSMQTRQWEEYGLPHGFVAKFLYNRDQVEDALEGLVGNGYFVIEEWSQPEPGYEIHGTLFTKALKSDIKELVDAIHMCYRNRST